MRTFPAKLILIVICACLALGGLAASPHRHHSHLSHRHKHIPSRAEIRATRARRAAARHKLHLLYSHMHQLKLRIKAVKAQEHFTKENIQTVQARIDRTKHNLNRINARLSQLTTEHVMVMQRLDETQRRLAQRRKLLALRIRDSYQRGQTTYAQVLLQSRSMSDLLSRGYYVRRIVHSDTELIQGVRRDVAQIQAYKRTIEVEKQEAQALAVQNEAQKEQLADDLREKQDILHQEEAQREAAQEEFDEDANESEEWVGRVQALAALQDRQERERRAGMPSFRHAGGVGRSGDDEPAPIWHGGFRLPCNGPITSGFGYRYHPILHYRRMHTGVDIGVPYGTPIHAAAAGRVLFAGYTSGYGNLVVLNHGNGRTTFYGHCSALLVSEGELIHQGQVIARVGATGLATGPHVHFEVRINGVPVNPL
ncbi:MAG TPA: peptidoglycan DD-metalloendopeptidase family protein [Chthonomonadaceae bacterium]|nr:peptidoglycan DD-metalloendopeptidase family protein [Chthonomonadaceae bacterium]